MKKCKVLLNLAGLGILALLVGCASTFVAPSWIHVKHGMDREMVRALLGPPKFTNSDNLQDVFAQPMGMVQQTQVYYDGRNAQTRNEEKLVFKELHVMYDAGGKVVKTTELSIMQQ